MKIEMKRKEILDLYRTLQLFSEEKLSKRFIFAIALNESALEDEVSAISKASKPAVEYEEYEQKRLEIISEHADKSSGDLITEGTYVKIKSDEKDVVYDKIKKLDDEYAGILDKRNKDLEDFNDLLESTVSVNLQTVKYDDLPSRISKKDFVAMRHIIDM